MKKLPTPAQAEKGRSRRKLKSVENLRRYIADVARELEDGGYTGELDRARIMIYAAKTLSDIMDRGQLEERIRVLEERLVETPAAH